MANFDPKDPGDRAQAEQQFNENMSLLKEAPSEAPVLEDEILLARLEALRISVEQHVAHSRAKSLALTKLDEARHWLREALS